MERAAVVLVAAAAVAAAAAAAAAAAVAAVAAVVVVVVEVVVANSGTDLAAGVAAANCCHSWYLRHSMTLHSTDLHHLHSQHSLLADIFRLCHDFHHGIHLRGNPHGLRL